MADYKGKLTGKQIDELPDKVTELSQKVGEIDKNQTTVNEIKQVMETLPDGSAVSAQVAVNSGKISELEGNFFEFKGIELSTSGQSYRLFSLESGICVNDTSYQLSKYKVVAGTKIRLILSEDYIGGNTYQFQNTEGVSTSTSTQQPRMVGVPCKGNVNSIVTVPDGATWLIVSQLKTNNTNKVELVKGTLGDRIKKVEDVTDNIDWKYELTKSVKAGRFNEQTNITLKEGITYTMSVKCKETPSAYIAFDFRDKDGNILSGQARINNGSKYNSLMFTADKDYEDFVIGLYSSVDASAEELYVEIVNNATLVNQINELKKCNSVKDNIVSLNNECETTNYLQNAVYKAKKSNNGSICEPFTFIHFSDIHGDALEVKRLLEFNEYYSEYIDEIVHTGDSVSNVYADGMDFWNNVEGSTKIINIVGNHDCAVNGSYSGSNGFSSSQIFSLLMGGISTWGVTYQTGINYFYKDYADKRIRAIFLDYIFWDDTQKAWLSNLLDGAKNDGLSVVIFNHCCPSSDIERLESSFTSLQYKPSYNTNYGAVELVDGFIVSGGDFVAWIVGHSHFDYIGTIGNGKQAVIVVDTAKCTEGYSDGRRIVGEKSQDCANIVSVDVPSGTIRVHRIGMDTDRWLRHKGNLCYDYKNKALLWND